MISTEPETEYWAMEFSDLLHCDCCPFVWRYLLNSWSLKPGHAMKRWKGSFKTTVLWPLIRVVQDFPIDLRWDINCWLLRPSTVVIPSRGSMEIEKASHILLGHNERCLGRLIELLEQWAAEHVTRRSRQVGQRLFKAQHTQAIIGWTWSIPFASYQEL